MKNEKNDSVDELKNKKALVENQGTTSGEMQTSQKKQKKEVESQKTLTVKITEGTLIYQEMVNLLTSANNKKYGAKLTEQDLVIHALGKLTSKDIHQLQDKSLSSRDKILIQFEESFGREPKTEDEVWSFVGEGKHISKGRGRPKKEDNENGDTDDIAASDDKVDEKMKEGVLNLKNVSSHEKSLQLN